MYGMIVYIPYVCTCSEWSMEGVKLLSKNETHYTCQSNHLTSFAVLVSTTPVHQVMRLITYAILSCYTIILSVTD